MLVESGTAIVRASPQAIFDYLANPANLPRMLASNVTVAIEDIHPLPGGGYRYRWDYNLFGMRLRFGADAEVVELVPGRRFAVRSYGGIETLSAWDLEPDERGTRATFSISCQPDNNLLARMSQGFIASQLRYSVGVALMKIKELVEAETAAPDHVGT